MVRRAMTSKIAAAVRVALLSSAPWLAAHAATLPIPCGGGACVNIPGVPSTTGLPFASSGSASWAEAGSKLTVNQTSETAILNWRSFNISADGTVQFVQPDSNSVALNEIYDSSPTQIFGALDANGKIFLINQNGIIFGGGATVNVGGLVASTLPISSDAATKGLTDPSNSGQAAFQAVPGYNSGSIQVQQGATLQTADGGQIFLFAPDVTNDGVIHTPDGQTVLAAGTSVYLAASPQSDPNLRGVLVEVQGKGTVTNGLASNSNATSPQQLVGQIIAEDGNISIAAYAVNQYGRLNATTSVNENGTILLQARQGVIDQNGDEPGAGGNLTLGRNSDTEVTLDTSDTTLAADGDPQPKSTIMMSGDQIDMLQGSVARATGGVIDVYADSNLGGADGLQAQLLGPSQTSDWGKGLTLGNTTHSSDGSRFYMASGAVLDVSGASVTLPVSDDVISAQLEATELEDSPLLRDGPLHGATIDFDIRAHGTNADGTTWWGTPVANVSGQILDTARNVVERNLTGGTVNIQSQGDVITAPSSQINVSGGYIQYTGGYVSTSDLLTLWGQTVPVGSASPDMPYAGIVNSATTTNAKWGVTDTYQTTPSYYSPGYVEGKDAGTLSLTATSFILDGTVSASTEVGPYQTLPSTAEPPATQPTSMTQAEWLAEWADSTWVHTTDGSTVTPAMYRPYDQVPAGATLRIGTPGAAQADLVVNNNITIAAGEELAGLKNADGSAFDPLADPLPADFTTSILQPSILDAFQNVSVYTNGKLLEAPGVSLSLAPGGSFTAQAASIDIEGGIDIPSGTINLKAEPTWTDWSDPNLDTVLTLGSAASLTVTGQWVNDSSVLYPDGNPAPVYIDGGDISLAASNPGIRIPADLLLKPGSLIDVSAGAQLTSSGSLNAGKGGAITIDASTAMPAGIATLAGTPLGAPELELGATLRGYGLYEGGSLSIGAAGVCIAASDCSGGDPTVVWLTPAFFNSGGFSSYSVTGDQKGLSVASGLDLQLIQRNFELPSGYEMMPDAATLVGIATTGVLPLNNREPVDLTLALNYPVNFSEDLGTTTSEELSADYGPLPSLIIPHGDVIATDPSGSISLTADTQLDVEGQLRAPGGTISLALDAAPGAQVFEYDPAQGIWLGSSAVLDASGTAMIFPNAMGNPTGNVLPGGKVSLDAEDGYLELLPGSTIDVSGTSGVIDISPVGGGLIMRERIASAGGEIDLFSSDGGVIGGTLLAAAGAAGPGANQPAGGSLYLTEQSTLDYDAVPASDIRISPTLSPTIVAPGSAVPEALEGLTLFPTSTIAQAGFSIVALTSTAYNASETYGAGEIELSGGASLTASREVSLDASVYTVDPGTTGSIEAPYVEFGSSFIAPDYLQYATSGPGVLDVSGGFIELYGTSLLEGIGTADFDSAGDLRLRGVQLGNNNPTISGGLYAGGTIELTAQQIYPTTLTPFVISADPSFDYSVDPTIIAQSPPSSGSIVIQGSEGANTDLLSAGGTLTLVAASITQDGVLRAPFGTITLDATSLALGSGSLTSTSADGLTIPFGTTQGNTQGGAESTYDWVYTLLSTYWAVYGTGHLPPPSQHIDLNAADIDVQSGAVMDISGGGDLLAYEWVPGTGGTQDILACSDCYAIIPSLDANVAPYDPAIAASTGINPQVKDGVYPNLQVGDAVHLSAGSGVPAGTYILLPARYALLPGAYLVTPMAGNTYQDMQPGQTFTASDGGTIVSGYLTATGLSFGSSRLNGFDVTPSSIFLKESQYNLTTGNQFFSGEQAAATSSDASEAVSAMRLPEDGGVVSIDAGSFLALDGTLRATAAQSDASGGEVDISNRDIVVAANTAGVSQSGALVLTASSLDQLGAQTLLLGGTDEDGAIAADAQTVTILSGASLSAPQLLLAAQQQISVQDGASLTAAGTAPSAGSGYSLSDTGAFLGVTTGSQFTVTSAGGSDPAGDIELAAGSSLSAGKGSLYLDATAGISAGGSIGLSGGSLAVQAPDIVLGNVTGTSGAAVLGASVLGEGSLENLLLVSHAAITIADGAAASAQNITIDAPGLTSELTAGQTATLSASSTLTLGDSASAAAQSTGTASNPASGSDSGSLVLTGPNIALGDNLTAASSPAAQQVALDGFSSVAINAQNTVTAAYDVTVLTDSDLSITASHVTTAAGVNAYLEAGYVDTADTFHPESVSLLAPEKPTALSSPVALGGSLTVTGSSIEVGTDLDLPSGNVTLASTGGDISVQSGGAIDVAGVVQQYDTQTEATPGGTVSLSASSGDIELANGSSIDVSAGTGGMAGSLSLSAPTGMVLVANGANLEGAGTAQGGSFSVDALSFGAQGFNTSDTSTAFGALSAMAEAGGFSESQSYRLRGCAAGSCPDSFAGNSGLAVDTTGLTLDQKITASNVFLEADSGAITIDGSGKIDASGSSGGSVTLSAADGITLTGAIDAHATSQSGRGGTVELDLGDNSSAQLTLDKGSQINVSGGTAELDGTVLLRVPQATVENVANGLGGVTLAGTIAGASSTVLEAYRVYDDSGNVDIGASDADATSSQYYSDANSFMSGYAVTATANLEPAAGWNFVIEPGMDIDTPGNIELDANWILTPNLSTPTPATDWRFSDGSETVPGILTLRAGGSVTFNDSLTDGFKKLGGLVQDGSSWSYRIVAGADFTAANPLAVGTDPAAGVTISGGSSGAMVRTGTGFIKVAASGNFTLSTPDSVLYTAGADDGTPPCAVGGGACSGTPLPDYSTGGGDITIDVGGDIEGAAATDQFVNQWLWRQGDASTPTAWSIDFAQFQQGVGALGGGDVTIRAGGSIENFSASIPSIGVVSSGGGVDVEDGGDLVVSAGGSILGGSYYVGFGSATLSAGDTVGLGTGQANPLSPLIGLGDASISITARGDLQVSGIVNPTLLDGSSANDSGSQSYFSTYGPASSTTLTSIGGDVTLNDDYPNIDTQYGSGLTDNGNLGNSAQGEIADAPGALAVVSPSLTLASLSGDVDANRPMLLFPSPQGNLEVLAAQNIDLGESEADVGQLVVPDLDPSAMPSIADPAQGVSSLDDAFPFENNGSTSALQHGSTPLFGSVSAYDENPVLLVASNGSVNTTVNGDVGAIWSGKPVIVSAGQDIVNLNLTAQNLSRGDVTSITAAGDIEYNQPREPTSGELLTNGAGITVAGPGELQVTAGGNVDLGTSSGIKTIGNEQNRALPSTGAGISVEAGVGGTAATAAQYSAFIQQYIDGSSEFDGQLVSDVEQIMGQDGLPDVEAKQEFDGMEPEQQRIVLERIFFQLLETYGEEAAKSGNNADFAGAYAAIQTLFPGANPDLSKGQTDPYSGSISLYFSQVYTEDGGGISLLAPGGEVNAGLALVPKSYGLDKTPDELGVVAEGPGDVDSFSYGDFQVNQSRVFAADGGNMMIWSTEGNIDAGRGSKTSLSAAAPSVNYDSNGFPTIIYEAPTSGSGIQALADTPGTTPGTVYLFAPHGVVNANDAGIAAGNLVVAATAVLGTNNISVSGTEIGVPVAVTGTGASVVGASSSAGGALSSAQSNLAQQTAPQQQAPKAAAELRWLDVFVLGFGEQTCSASDIQCLKRQQHTAN